MQSIYFKKILLIFPIIIITFSSVAQTTTIEERVFLLGNFVDIEHKAIFLNKLDKTLAAQKEHFVLVATGDFVDDFIENEGQEEQLKPIFELIELFKRYPNGQLVLLPGDRDWNDSKKKGVRSVNNLEKRVKAFIRKKQLNNVDWPIKHGCPGPKVLEVSKALAIITYDSQWWNHPHDKPIATDAICGGLSAENLKNEMNDAINKFNDRNILIVAHHPIFSLGNYGGYFSAIDKLLLPFPVLSEFKTAFHANVGNEKDLSNSRLHKYTSRIDNSIYYNQNIIYASGHEKNQQVITSGDNFLINSGAPESAKFATKDNNTVFSASESGLIELRYYNSGKVKAAFLKNTESTFAEEQNFDLFYPACGDSSIEDKPVGRINTSYMPCEKASYISAKSQEAYPAPKIVAAGAEYKANGWKRFWVGDHYRTTWTAPLKVSYLNLDTVFGGLTVYKKGGGRQTNSLKFKTDEGAVYTFRSVNKDPSKSLDHRIRETFVTDFIRDQTSTQHPYGAMVVAPLLDKIDILHATPRLFLLPDDHKLGVFQKSYGNMLGQLEESPGKIKKGTLGYFDADQIVQSVDMFKKKYKSQKVEIAITEFVRARIFDMWVGDWSKHEDNWKWAIYKKGGKDVYRPIPRDRDHVFSRQDGLINWLADRRFGMITIENFGYKIPDILSLTYQARQLDQFIITPASKDVFIEQAKYIQQQITDTDIEKAVRELPEELYEISGREVEAKLKKRLEDLVVYAEKYYHILAKEVDVVGTNEREYFDVKYNHDGSVQVNIFDVKKNAKGERLLYQRLFFPNETKEIRLWGLDDDDIFNFYGDGKNTIKVRAFGGTGLDDFKDNASIKTLLYDKGTHSNYAINGDAVKKRFWDKKRYDYDRLRIINNHYLPLAYLKYNEFSGFGLAAGVSYTFKKFAKSDYASKHMLSAGFTLNDNKHLTYKGRYHHVIQKWDFETKLEYLDSDFFNYFFGVGSNTIKDEGLFDQDFYEAQVRKIGLSLGLVRSFLQNSEFKINAGIERDKNESIENTILSNDFQLLGANEELTILPVELILDLDFRDGKGLPYRGSRALLGFYNGTILNRDNSNFSILSGTLEQYFSTPTKRPFTLGLRAGGAKGFDDIPWYKLPMLGATTGLRGYYQNRFASKSILFFNSEVRYQFLEIKTSFVPLKIGVKAFYDVGQVFQPNEENLDKWRSGYGFGFFVVPLDERYTFSVSLGFSTEETIYPSISFGRPLL